MNSTTLQITLPEATVKEALEQHVNAQVLKHAGKVLAIKVERINHANEEMDTVFYHLTIEPAASKRPGRPRKSKSADNLTGGRTIDRANATADGGQNDA